MDATRDHVSSKIRQTQNDKYSTQTETDVNTEARLAMAEVRNGIIQE